MILRDLEDISAIKLLSVIGWRMKERRRPVLGNNLAVAGVIRLLLERDLGAVDICMGLMKFGNKYVNGHEIMT